MAYVRVGDYNNIVDALLSIIEQSLPFKVDAPPSFVGLPPIETGQQDAHACIKYYMQHPELITKSLIRSIVEQQLQKIHTWQELEFKLIPASNSNDSNYSFAARWQNYLDRLEYVLAEVKYRSDNNYEFNMLMPPQRQMLKLQQECLDLTSEWHGEQNANISCFYSYFIRMCEVARITRYAYLDLSKERSQDNFITQVNIQQRNHYAENYMKNIYNRFILQGGLWTHGRSDIDATNIANVLYSKYALQLLYLQAVKHAVVNIFRAQKPELHIESYGQIPDECKEKIWSLIQDYFPANSDSDKSNIFYKFANFINHNPGEYFVDIPHELHAHNLSDHQVHVIIQVAGLVSGNLTLISRKITENWTPKRYLYLTWDRKYPLNGLRKAGICEHMRIWPNEMAYCPTHGLSLCGDGMLEGLDKYETLDYEWNVPVDTSADIVSNERDIEKMFREMQMLCPNVKSKPLLPGEQLLNVFQNTIAYSTQSTQHIHITSGCIDDYLLYKLSSDPKYITDLNATLDIVQVGNCVDAILVKLQFYDLDNEILIKFLLDLNTHLLDFFGGIKNIDVMLVLLPTQDGKFIFIFEPHARLQLAKDGKFFNPENLKTHIRKPQWVRPLGNNVSLFDNKDQLSKGLDFLHMFYADTCKLGVHACISNFISQWLQDQKLLDQ